MEKVQQIVLKDIPSTVRSRLYRRRGCRPDMDIRTGNTHAIVVFDANIDGVSAYCRMGEKGERMILSILTEPTRSCDRFYSW